MPGMNRLDEACSFLVGNGQPFPTIERPPDED